MTAPGIPVVLREHRGPARLLAAASWRRVHRPGGIETATVACPGCGRAATLDHHAIAADGLVQASLLCPDRCGFNDHVLLKNWGDQ